MDKFIAFLVASVQLITIASAKEKCCVVPIEEWSGESSRRNESLHTPVGIVVIQHTVSSPCHTDRICEALVRNLRDFQINHVGYVDIGISFLVGGNGKVYEGAGWNRVGAHTIGYNDKAIAISFIGNFSDVLPTPEALRAAQLLLECGTKNKFLREDYDLVGHRQLSATISPGDALQNEIKTWPHWTEALKAIYKDEETRPIQLHRGVRHGDVISPKLFTNALEDVFKTLDWAERGINVIPYI